MPASMGMMMLGRLIMSLTGDRDSWDQRSLMMGMMMGGGMGGGMMGGMGGGMGGMGGGMGGMGGGFRSVPPTGLPETTLKPHQVRHLPTPVISMNGPDANSQPVVPAAGEKLRIAGVEQWTDDSRTRKALRRLAEAKAPQTVAQMAIWYVTTGASWEQVGRFSQGWGNASELALAQRLVEGLDQPRDRSVKVDQGLLYWELKGETARPGNLAEGLRALWAKYPVLGLTAKEGVPESPKGPAIACSLNLSDSAVDVKLMVSHPSGTDWVKLGDFRLKRPDRATKQEAADQETSKATQEREAARFGDTVAEGVLAHLVRVQLSRGPRVKGKESFRIKIINDSPMILNGLALGGAEVSETKPPSVLAGFCLPPLKSLTVPASGEMVERHHLKAGIHVLAADLTGL